MRHPIRARDLLILAAIVASLSLALPRQAAAADPNVETISSLVMQYCSDRPDCLDSQRDRAYPFGLALGMITGGLDRTVLQVRLVADDGGPWSSFPASGDKVAAGEGILWEVTPEAVRDELGVTMAKVKKGFRMRLRITNKGGKTKNCPSVAILHPGTKWQYYHGDNTFHDVDESGMLAIQGAMVVPLEGTIVCQHAWEDPQ